ncbi:hypothetical protein KTR66_19340 [Roseococcus sp. SDR]|uniref:glycine-rich domain-containing protein n=1 Tax=Roseococcus sp. SDR TaxID=2835532 RepID=UPI001BD1AC54|nr:hypothetical protein [Roseococcus sp. SDR]MBS7792162.1 hypothetical protein [Roseococcus sp. SDR]MBV1847476.1 hypothetical protein [Roseococcus sp. SDR]
MTQVIFPPAWGGSGIAYSDDATGARDMRDGGFRNWLLPMLGEGITVLDAATQAAILAAGNAIGGAATQASSTTSLSIGVGSQVLTVQAGKNFVIGMPVRLANSASAFMDGTVTAYNATTGALTVSVSQITGSGTFAAWNVFLAGQPAALPALLRDARSTNTALGTAARGTYLDLTGSFTQTFAAAATLGNGWHCYIVNNGTGDITLDPNGAELIDGLASFVMYPGEARLVLCTGAGFVSLVLRAFRRRFDASGTFTTPPGYTQFAGLAWGAGGSGRKSDSGTATFGGGGGACVPFHLPAAALGASQSVTIGAGGASVSAALTNGATGGNTSLGSLVTAFGGGGGNLSGGGAGGGALSAGTFGDSGGGAPSMVGVPANSGFGGSGPGAPSAYGGAGAATGGAPGGASLYGGGGGGSCDSAGTLRAAGGSVFGGAGGACGDTTSGTAGAQPGGGGGGTRTGAVSGAGGAGRLDIWGIL